MDKVNTVKETMMNACLIRHFSYIYSLCLENITFAIHKLCLLSINSVTVLKNTIHLKMNKMSLLLLIGYYIVTVRTLESFDNRSKNSTFYVLHSALSVNKSQASDMCKSVGLELPSIKNNMLDLLNLVGHWKIPIVFFKDERLNDTVAAMVVPSLVKQKFIFLHNISRETKFESIVCSKIVNNGNSNINSCFTIFLTFSTILTLFIIFIIIFIIIKLFFYKNNLTPPPPPTEEGFKRLRFSFL